MRSFTRFQLVFVLGLYFFLSILKIKTSDSGSLNDLMVHLLGFTALMCSGMFAFPHRMYIAKLFIAFFLFSIFVESVQYFLPYRSFSLLDIVANGMGLFIGIVLSLFIMPIYQSIHAYKGY